MHSHTNEVYEMRDGKLYRNLRLANQIAKQPLHFDQPIEEQANGPRMLTWALGFSVVFWGILAVAIYVWRSL